MIYKNLILLTVMIVGCNDITKTDRPKVDPAIASEITEVVFINKRSFSESVKEAERTNKPLLVYFSADWCGPCRAMKRTVLKDARVKKKMENFVVYFCDVDLDKHVLLQYKEDLGKIYGSVPSYVAHKPGNTTTRYVGVGQVSTATFLKFLNSIK